MAHSIFLCIFSFLATEVILAIPLLSDSIFTVLLRSLTFCLFFIAAALWLQGLLVNQFLMIFFKMVPPLVTAVPGRWWCWEGDSSPLRYHSSLCSPIITSRQPISIFRTWPFPSFMNTGNQLQTYSQHPQLSFWLLTWSSKEAGICGWRPCASTLYLFYFNARWYLFPISPFPSLVSSLPL